MERKGIIAAGNMLVDHVHQIGQWPERGWLVEIVHSERATGGAPLNVLLTLAKMHAGLPLQAVGLIGEDNDGDYITAMLDQYHINRQLRPHLDDPGDDRRRRPAHFLSLSRRQPPA
ncbi:hypothetical protein SB04496_00805 [Klebsiella pneumoniae]|nr:kinase [Klebsiella pneumoniae]VGO89527.1 hypothetical protein SB04496_00805 [Klebsiella pneumoniae]